MTAAVFRSETLRGIVLREIPQKEQDKLLTVFTRERGKILLSAHGVRSVKSRNLACTQLLCYAEFTVEQRRGRYTLKESNLLENFYAIRSHLDAFAFSQYLCEVCCASLAEEMPEEPLLRLILNTLYAAQSGLEISKIKAAFELRLCKELGFLPELEYCVDCGGKAQGTRGDYLLDTTGGGLLCPDCAAKKAIPDPHFLGLSGAPTVLPSSVVSLSEAVLAAMRYVCRTGDKRIFAFTLPKEEQKNFSAVCESYLLNQFGRGFETLSFYKDLLKTP